jgi:hypothetical protein
LCQTKTTPEEQVEQILDSSLTLLKIDYLELLSGKRKVMSSFAGVDVDFLHLAL